MDQKLEMLRRVPLFEGLKPQGLAEIGRLADEISVASGTELCTEGRTGGEFFVIVDGAVDISRGGEHLTTLHGGEFFGEIALVDGGPRTATARTSSPTRLLVIGHREFHTLLEDFKDIHIQVLEALARRIRAVDQTPT